MLRKLDWDVVIMLTDGLVWSSIMLLDTWGKELINWELLLCKDLHHSSQLAPWVLKWGVWHLFLSLGFSMLVSIVLHLVVIFLISLILTVRLLIPQEKEKFNGAFFQSCDNLASAGKYDLNLWLHKHIVFALAIPVQYQFYYFNWCVCSLKYRVH